jgi:hypothetical protein
MAQHAPLVPQHPGGHEPYPQAPHHMLPAPPHHSLPAANGQHPSHQPHHPPPHQQPQPHALTAPHAVHLPPGAPAPPRGAEYYPPNAGFYPPAHQLPSPHHISPPPPPLPHNSSSSSLGGPLPMPAGPSSLRTSPSAPGTGLEWPHSGDSSQDRRPSVPAGSGPRSQLPSPEPPCPVRRTSEILMHQHGGGARTSDSYLARATHEQLGLHDRPMARRPSDMGGADGDDGRVGVEDPCESPEVFVTTCTACH